MLNCHSKLKKTAYYSLIKMQFSKFVLNANLLNMENFQKLNRLKAVLADAGQTNKWLAEQLGKDPVTVSKWCTNTSQPNLQTLAKISDLLKVNIRELLVERNNWQSLVNLC